MLDTVSPGVASFFLLRDDESTTDSLAKLSSSVRGYARGAVIYRQGESGAHFYQLLAGSLFVSLLVPHPLRPTCTFVLTRSRTAAKGEIPAAALIRRNPATTMGVV